MKTPTAIAGIFEPLVKALSGYRGNKNFAKPNVTLRCDFVCESRKLILEYDERQHFSEARAYYDLNHPFKVDTTSEDYALSLSLCYTLTCIGAPSAHQRKPRRTGFGLMLRITRVPARTQLQSVLRPEVPARRFFVCFVFLICPMIGSQR